MTIKVPSAPLPPVHGIQPPAPVDLESNTAENWKLFKQIWKNCATTTRLRKQPADYEVALLLHTVGDGELRIYNGFTFETVNGARSVDEIRAKFKIFSVGEANECYESLYSTTETNNKARHSSSS